MELSRLSLNQMTTEGWSVREAAEGCAAHGIPWIGLWRHKVAQTGLVESARIVRECGLRVSSLCRGGMFPAVTVAERAARVDDNLRAIDEAAALGTDVLVLVCGGLDGQDLESARRAVEEGIERIIPHAQACGIRLGIEPLHPVFAADRSVVATLAQANDMAERLGAQVGVVIDVYHVWWDPALFREIERARGRILGFHVNDWGLPIHDPLMSRAMMGDGVIEIGRMRQAVETEGYSGPIEVEIFNRAIWDTPGEQVLELMKARFASLV